MLNIGDDLRVCIWNVQLNWGKHDNGQNINKFMENTKNIGCSDTSHWALSELESDTIHTKKWILATSNCSHHYYDASAALSASAAPLPSAIGFNAGSS
jgi:hypothetical protein